MNNRHCKLPPKRTPTPIKLCFARKFVSAACETYCDLETASTAQQRLPMHCLQDDVAEHIVADFKYLDSDSCFCALDSYSSRFGFTGGCPFCMVSLLVGDVHILSWSALSHIS